MNMALSSPTSELVGDAALTSVDGENLDGSASPHMQDLRAGLVTLNCNAEKYTDPDEVMILIQVLQT